MSTLKVCIAAAAMLLASSLPAAAQSGEDAARPPPERAIVSVKGSARLLELPVGIAAHLCLRANPGLIFGSDDPARDTRDPGAPACEITQALAAEVAGERWTGGRESQSEPDLQTAATTTRHRGSSGDRAGGRRHDRGDGNANGANPGRVRGGSGSANGKGEANGRNGR